MSGEIQRKYHEQGFRAKPVVRRSNVNEEQNEILISDVGVTPVFQGPRSQGAPKIKVTSNTATHRI